MHIIERHPIMEDYFPDFKGVLEKPEDVRFSNQSDNVLLFYRFFDKIESGKYIVIVVNKESKSVTTAYLSHRIKIGKPYEIKQKF